MCMYYLAKQQKTINKSSNIFIKHQQKSINHKKQQTINTTSKTHKQINKTIKEKM